MAGISTAEDAALVDLDSHPAMARPSPHRRFRPPLPGSFQILPRPIRRPFSDRLPLRGAKRAADCGRQTPTRHVGAEVDFSSLRSQANSRGEAGRTTPKASDVASHGVRAARSTRRSMNWHVLSALPPKAGRQEIGSASGELTAVIDPARHRASLAGGVSCICSLFVRSDGECEAE
jgi:hypothetical protein